MRRLFSLALCLFLCLTCLPTALGAGGLRMEDGADLLTQKQEADLQAKYAGITRYMDAAFVTASDARGASTERLAEQYAIRTYGNDPAVVFLIDMDNRQIYIYANGEAQSAVSRADARAITDNVYRFASKEDYYGCADSAFSQILARCEGQEIARPVKHITNAMIAVLFGILLNYLLVVYSRRRKTEKHSVGDVSVSATRVMAEMPAVSVGAPVVLSSVKRYKSRSSGGSRGGGGGHSGGGGGHGF